jgi:hypothetical protein
MGTYFRPRMWKFWLLGIVCLVCTGAATCQTVSDEELVRYRVGSSFDSKELAYFGLFAYSADRVDSMQYGTISGSFYVHPYSKGTGQRIILSSAAQAEFLRLIASYEKFAIDPRNLDLKALSVLALKPPVVTHKHKVVSILSRGYIRLKSSLVGIKSPLLKHEHNGYFCTVQTTTGKTFYGELAYVSNHKIVLYEVDLGYEAVLVKDNLKVYEIDSLQELKIYRRNVAKYVGLATGLAVGIAFSGAGYSPFTLEGDNAQIAANMLVLPAAGFGIGFLLDEVVSFKTTYNLQKPASREKGIERAKRGVMFPKALPPEFERLLSPTP